MGRINGKQTKTRKGHHCRVKRWIVLWFGLCGIGIYTGLIVSFNTPKHMQYMAKGDNSDVELTLKWTPNMDFLDEEIALKDPPLVDIKKSVDVRNSKVYLPGNNTFYEVGDTVKVRIDLFDGYGNQRHRGGDQLRVRIVEDLLSASAAGYVLDHKNGSYTAVLRCLWAGTPDILVYIAYTREAVRALYHIRDKLPATHNIYVNYKNNESKRCHALIRAFSQSTRLCNMTSYNGEMSWYCEAPSGKTTCSYYIYSPTTSKQKEPVTEGEETLFKRNRENLFPIINIIVKERSTQSNELKKQTTCNLFNRTKLWFMPSPIGHFMHNRWQTEHCKMTPADRFSQCLRNKHVLLYGDSTTRQWFANFRERFKCVLKSEAWHQAKWKKDSKAFCPSMNLTLEWIVHSHPGNIVQSPVRIKRNSIAEHMLQFAENKNAIFVIHMFSHLSAYHHDVFRDRIAHISKSVNSILKINKEAKILIKGGHTYSQARDYYGYVYRQITTEEFRGLYDKVVYLDSKDMTIAREVKSIHPDETVVTEMVNQMLSYVCR